MIIFSFNYYFFLDNYYFLATLLFSPDNIFFFFWQPYFYKTQVPQGVRVVSPIIERARRRSVVEKAVCLLQRRIRGRGGQFGFAIAQARQRGKELLELLLFAVCFLCTNHVPIMYQPSTIYQPSTNHLPTIYQPCCPMGR